MNTAHGRLQLIRRDAASAAFALEQLHRCVVKIKGRCEKLGTNPNAAAYAAAYLADAERCLGQTLGHLDLATSVIEAERKRKIIEYRKREQ